jgi:GNAT superfamily N-acetyltransferase
MTTTLAREIQSFLSPPALPADPAEVAALGFRPLGPADGLLVADALEGLSARSRQMRFAASMPTLPDRLVRYLSTPDGRRHVAWGVFAGGRLAAMGRFVRLADDPSTAEVALTVTDRWQGRGLGPALLRRLAGSARELGVERFAFTVSGDNRPAQKMLGRLGVVLRYSSGLGEGFLPVTALLATATAPALRDAA